MHSSIASLICCALLFIQGYAEEEKDFQCKQNVPGKAEKALLDAINEQRSKHGILNLEEGDYDCGLAKKASVRDIEGSVFTLNGESTFEKDWDETLKNALKTSREYGITMGAEKIGCEITLTTTPDDGSHKANLYCLLEMRNLPSNSVADVADAAKM